MGLMKCDDKRCKTRPNDNISENLHILTHSTINFYCCKFALYLLNCTIRQQKYHVYATILIKVRPFSIVFHLCYVQVSSNLN